MYPWLPYWNAMFRFPLSGPTTVAQDIHPLTELFSPDVTIYAGDAGIEAEVTRKVASFGTQLGILTEAVEELAKATKAKGAALDRLRKVAAEIDKVKEAHGVTLEGNAIRALEALRVADEKAHDKLLKERLDRE